jgi:hypothetical protein
MRKAVPVLLTLALGLAACGQSETSTVSTPGGTVTTRTTDGGATTTITGPDGSTAQITSGAGAKADLPDFLPLYPGATVTSSITGGNGTQKTVSVTFETNAAPAEVIAFYKEKAAAMGLGETLNADQGGVLSFMATKDQTLVQVLASKGTNATEAQLTWAASSGG